MPLFGASGKHRSIRSYEATSEGKSCSFKGLAILLRNRLNIAVYGFKPRITWMIIGFRKFVCVASVANGFATKAGLLRVEKLTV